MTSSAAASPPSGEHDVSAWLSAAAAPPEPDDDPPATPPPSGPDLGPPPGGGAFEEATVVPTGHEVATLYRVAAPGHLNCRRIVDWRWRWARRPEARETGWDVVRCGPLGLFVLATRLEPWPGEPGG